MLPRAFQSYKPWHMQVYGVILINSTGHVLLVRGRQGGKWSFPKGHKKRSESDLQCALRELQEETGITLCSSAAQEPTYHKLAKAGYFLYTVDDTCCARVNDSTEIDQVAWWPVLELPTCNSNVDVSLFRSHMQSAKRIPSLSSEVIQTRTRLRPLPRSIFQPSLVPLCQDTIAIPCQGAMSD
jgi:ADP-ribose pyrophosphatase YjhB (NUDIX family)